MSVAGICCNKELASSCMYNCDKHYCTNTEAIVFNQVDRSCSGYINKDVFTKMFLQRYLKSLKVCRIFKMTNCIVCYNTGCKHCSGTGCDAAVVEVGYDGSCLTYEEIDIYKEVEERSNV